MTTIRRNGIVIDEDGPWTAAAYLRTDPGLAEVQHGVHDGGTLCGLPENSIAIARNPFWGTRDGDCVACAARLKELAE